MTNKKEQKERTEKKKASDEKNLAPYKFTKGDPRSIELAKKGAEASIKARRKRRAMREDAKILLNMPLETSTLNDINELQSLAEVKGVNITTQEAILYQLVIKARKGDIKAIELLYDLIGEKAENNTDNDLVRAFIDKITE